MVLAFAAACTPTYAPPLQTTHGGAPARVAEGDLALRGSAVGLQAAPSMGGPALSYGITDAWAVEGGGNFSTGAWGLGWAGARYTHAPRRFAKHYLALDVHGAGGMGWGGSLRGNQEDEGSDGLRASERVAGGGALGVGVSGHFSFFSIYGRTRAQLTAATNVPATVWGDFGAGVQFRILKTVDLYSQATWFGYGNQTERLFFRVPAYEVGIAVRIPTRRSRYRYR